MKYLPFDINEMETLKDLPEVEVDMSDHNFPTDGRNPINICFIYLRNIGFNNLKLNFSKCKTIDKFNFLAFYASFICVENNNQEFVDSWMSILTGNKYEKCILDDSELAVAKETLPNLIANIKNLAASIPIYTMMRFKGNSTLYDMDFPEQKTEIGINFINLIKHPDFIQVMTAEFEEKSPAYYKEYFTEYDNELCEAVMNLPCFAILYNLATDKDNKVKQVLECGKNAQPRNNN